MPWQQQIPGLHQEYHCQQFKGGCLLLCWALVRHLESCVQFWATCARATWTYWSKCSQGSCRGLRLEHLSYKEGLRDLSLFSLLKKRLFGGDLHHLNKYLTMLSKDGGARLFSVIPSDRARGNGHNLKQEKLHLGLRKKDFNITDIHCPENLQTPWR